MAKYQDLLDEVRAVMRRGDDAACPDLANVLEGLLVELVAQDIKIDPVVVSKEVAAAVEAEFSRRLRDAGQAGRVFAR